MGLKEVATLEVNRHSANGVASERASSDGEIGQRESHFAGTLRSIGRGRLVICQDQHSTGGTAPHGGRNAPAGALINLFDRTITLLEGAMQGLEAFDIVLPATVAGLAIALIHSVLGIEVLRRGIIFIDLAIAQIAGLRGADGAVVARTFMEPDADRRGYRGLAAAAFSLGRAGRPR